MYFARAEPSRALRTGEVHFDQKSSANAASPTSTDQMKTSSACTLKRSHR